jgi:hypothetical protein
VNVKPACDSTIFCGGAVMASVTGTVICWPVSARFTFGSLYFADLQNVRIRKISLTVTITTVAGNGTPVLIGTSVMIYPMPFLRGC